MSVRVVTVTPNPALDLTYVLDAPLRPDGAVEVHRALSSTLEASGKGVNVARALTLAGHRAVAVLPLGGATGGQLADLLAAEGVPTRAVPQSAPTRLNTTVVHPGGHTTKVNSPGSPVSAVEVARLVEAVGSTLDDEVRAAAGAPGPDGVVLVVGGSLPPGAGTDVVGALVAAARVRGVVCVVDASGAALAAAVAAGAGLIAPNAAELAHVSPEVAALSPALRSGGSADSAGFGGSGTPGGLGRPASERDLERAVTAFCRRTGCSVLLSLGPQGALWSDGSRVERARGREVVPVNTAGAGDALLAGWLQGSDDVGERLATAVRWGAASCLAPTTVAMP